MKRFMKLLVLIAALGVVAAPACSPSMVTQRCAQMAKLACDASAVIPAVGPVVSPVCDLFASSATVQALCEKAGTKVSDFFAPFGEWLKKHGIGGLVSLKPALVVPKLQPDGGAPKLSLDGGVPQK